MSITTWVSAKTASALFKRLPNKGIDQITKRSFTERLNQVIHATVTDFKKKYNIPEDDVNGYHFVNSQVLVDALVKYSSLQEFGIEHLEAAFMQNPNIHDFKKEEINTFYNLFIEKIKSDDVLRQLNLDAHYKERIADIYDGQIQIRDYQKGLAISFEKSGKIYQAQGDTNRALESFKKYNKAMKSLVELNPRNTKHLNNLAISYEKLSEIYQAQGDNKRTSEFLKKYNKTLKSLIQLYPDRLDYQYNLYLSYQKLAKLSSDKKEKSEFRQKAKTIMQQLSESHPEFMKNIILENNNGCIGFLFKILVGR